MYCYTQDLVLNCSLSSFDAAFTNLFLGPLVVKEQIIISATKVATMLLKIDDVIAGSKSKMPPGPPGGGGLGDVSGGGMDMAATRTIGKKLKTSEIEEVAYGSD
jgi:hypothetical protein